MTLEKEIWQKNPYILENVHYWNTPLELQIVNITIKLKLEVNTQSIYLKRLPLQTIFS